MKVMPIPSIPGAFAREDGLIKLPETMAEMPNGGIRRYETKWVRGVERRASKTARHRYLSVLHRGVNYKVHRLVCEAFHGAPPSPQSVVIHINEDALDNRPENIRWGSQRENLNSPGYVEYCKGRTGERSPVRIGKKRREQDTG